MRQYASRDEVNRRALSTAAPTAAAPAAASWAKPGFGANRAPRGNGMAATGQAHGVVLPFRPLREARR